MKNLNWILHAISILCIVFLLFQNNTLKKSLNPNMSSYVASPAMDVKPGSSQIAYFVSDSLLHNLGFFKKSEEDFRNKQEMMTNELRKKEGNFQKEIQQLQANSQNLTRNELETSQKRLAKMEQELVERKEKLSEELASESAEFNEKLHQKVVSYLQEFNADKKFSFIFSVARDGNIFYADSAYDITPQMIKALNDKYSK